MTPRRPRPKAKDTSKSHSPRVLSLIAAASSVSSGTPNDPPPQSEVEPSIPPLAEKKPLPDNDADLLALGVVEPTPAVKGNAPPRRGRPLGAVGIAKRLQSQSGSDAEVVLPEKRIQPPAGNDWPEKGKPAVSRSRSRVSEHIEMTGLPTMAELLAREKLNTSPLGNRHAKNPSLESVIAEYRKLHVFPEDLSRVTLENSNLLWRAENWIALTLCEPLTVEDVTWDVDSHYEPRALARFKRNLSVYVHPNDISQKLLYRFTSVVTAAAHLRDQRASSALNIAYQLRDLARHSNEEIGALHLSVLSRYMKPSIAAYEIGGMRDIGDLDVSANLKSALARASTAGHSERENHKGASQFTNNRHHPKQKRRGPPPAGDKQPPTPNPRGKQ
jgi:hypothetical protein